MHKAFILLSLACSVSLSNGALADIYTCKHADGSTELTDTPCGRGSTTANVLRASKQVASAPASAPQFRESSQNGTKSVQNSTSASASRNAGLGARVEPNVQRARDNLRRDVLTKEMEDELRVLTNVQSKYNGGTPTLQPGESAASAQYLERRAQLFQTVSHHEKNIAAIKQELSNLR